MTINLPNFLTLSRIAVIPLLVALFYLGGAAANWFACALFALAAVTDFFDGYLARSRQQTSELGRFLDPVADKLLVAAVILMLVGFDRITGYHMLPAVVILCREILVSGLREYLAGIRVSMPVSQLSKWKTSLQLVALGILIIGDAGPDFVPVFGIGLAGLWLAALLTLITGYDYMRAGMRHIIARPREAERRHPLGDRGKSAQPWR